MGAGASTVAGHWKTSLHVGGLVTLVAGVHYMYMREYWVQVHASPVVYRYIDWTITVPLQMIEFNLILKAAKAPISTMGFWKLLIGTVLMLVFGYAGESGNCSSDCSDAVKQSFNNMRIIVSLGWCIYPAGYFFGFLMGSVNDNILNVVYNIADFVNKIGFVQCCWSCAKTDSEPGAGAKEALLA